MKSQSSASFKTKAVRLNLGIGKNGEEVRAEVPVQEFSELLQLSLTTGLPPEMLVLKHATA